jgi:hypothetical protein
MTCNYHFPSTSLRERTFDFAQETDRWLSGVEAKKRTMWPC